MKLAIAVAARMGLLVSRECALLGTVHRKFVLYDGLLRGRQSAPSCARKTLGNLLALL